MAITRRNYCQIRLLLFFTADSVIQTYIDREVFTAILSRGLEPRAISSSSFSHSPDGKWLSLATKREREGKKKTESRRFAQGFYPREKSGFRLRARGISRDSDIPVVGSSSRWHPTPRRRRRRRRAILSDIAALRGADEEKEARVYSPAMEISEKER